MVISFLVIAVCLFIGFLLVESKIAKIPVMPRALLRPPRCSCLLISCPVYIFKKRASKIMFTHNFITGIVYYIDLYYLPVYFQHVRGYNPITSGILILPLILSFSVGSSSSGVIIAKLGKVKPIITIGYILWVAGAGGKISISINSPIWMLCVVQIVEGLGFGFAFQPGKPFFFLILTFRSINF
jgi:MFS family permease